MPPMRQINSNGNIMRTERGIKKYEKKIKFRNRIITVPNKTAVIIRLKSKMLTYLHVPLNNLNFKNNKKFISVTSKRE